MLRRPPRPTRNDARVPDTTLVRSGEMEEVARAVADVGLDPKLFLGAADIYRLVTETSLGRETPEVRSVGLTADEVARIVADALDAGLPAERSEEHTSELQSLMRISYAVFCLKKKKKHRTTI